MRYGIGAKSSILRASLAAAIIATTAVAWSAPPRRSSDGLWTEVPVAEMTFNLVNKPRRALKSFKLNRKALTQRLKQAPKEGGLRPRQKPLVITVPRPEGGFDRFVVQETSIMEPALAAQFPDIKTFKGTGIDDPSATLRLDVSPKGSHAMVLSKLGRYFVEPTKDAVLSTYSSTLAMDLRPSPAVPHCLVTSNLAGRPYPGKTVQKPSDFNAGMTQRTFRLAVAATGEYTAKQGGTVQAALQAIVTTINRVVGIYERELSIRLVLVGKEASLIYVDASNDPYTNDDATKLLAENQTNIDATIGTNNYDIGHVFSTAGGGLAALGSACTDSKARGETGSSTPFGDPFDVDYVAHEMGHQFGANHTFNSETEYCKGNRNGPTAYEPGSGTTIMGYAGICGADNIAVHSGDYFHAASLHEVLNFLNSAPIVSCATTAAVANHPPNVSAGNSYTIPDSTPFTMTATGVDPDGDQVNYCWEEFDLGPPSPPFSDDGTRPIFRSFGPVDSAQRILPALDTSDSRGLIWGRSQLALGETFPVTDRVLRFGVTARDNRGGIAFASSQVTVTSKAGPFEVTQPHSGDAWTVGAQGAVSWTVANTDKDPVNCGSVRILLSEDGGRTFPTVLIDNASNDGSESILVPNTPSQHARIRIESIDNVFFALSDSDFSIGAPPAQRLARPRR